MRIGLLAALVLTSTGSLVSAQKQPTTLFELIDRSTVDPDEVRTVLARGADPNAGKYGRTPLAAAIRYGNIKVMRVLLDGGADVNGRSEANTPLCEAIGNSYGSNADDMVLVLLRRKADPNLKCAQGDSPLNKAIMYRAADQATMLVHAGARVNDASEYGTSPLHNAAWYGPARLVEFLIQKGAVVDAKDRAGTTALMKANNARVAEVLISHGANVNARDSKGESVLANHDRLNRTATIEVLRSHGAQ